MNMPELQNYTQHMLEFNPDIKDHFETIWSLVRDSLFLAKHYHWYFFNYSETKSQHLQIQLSVVK